MSQGYLAWVRVENSLLVLLVQDLTVLNRKGSRLSQNVEVIAHLNLTLTWNFQ
jgi:hypothetical protein